MIGSFSMDKNNFVSETKIGINILEFSNILKRGNKKDQIILSIEGKNLSITFNDEQDNKRKFTLPGLKYEEEFITKESLDEIEYFNSLKFRFLDLKNVLSDAKVISDSVEIEISLKPEKLIFSTQGCDDQKYENIFNLSEVNTEITLSCENMIFSIEFLESIVKSGSWFGRGNTNAYKNSVFTMFLTEDQPLKIEIEFLQNCKLTYFLAPRVEEDDEDDENYYDD